MAKVYSNQIMVKVTPKISPCPIGQYIVIKGVAYPYKFSSIPTNIVLTEYEHPQEYLPFCIYYPGSERAPEGCYCTFNGDIGYWVIFYTDKKGNWWGIIPLKVPESYSLNGIYEFSISWSGSPPPF